MSASELRPHPDATKPVFVSIDLSLPLIKVLLEKKLV